MQISAIAYAVETRNRLFDPGRKEIVAMSPDADALRKSYLVFLAMIWLCIFS